MRNCAQCNTNIDNLWRERKFCSRSCSTTFKNNNTHSTKGKGKGKPICINQSCLNTTVSYSHKQCRKCIDTKQNMNYSQNPTKDSLVEIYTKKNHRSSAYSYIRWHARNVILKNKWIGCQICGYDKHTEVCHLKAIKDFDGQCTINEINDISNLIRLCPNCHWEHDNL